MTTSAWQDELHLRTYLLGPADPNPPWHRGGHGRVYPYPMQDDLTEEVREVPYRALHLENEYLHAIVLPELGGHLYSLYDKTAGREVFYRNNVVKYGLVARRAAWISGGIEFNFPQGHTCVTVSPVPSTVGEDRETGAASITIGYTERVCRMRCSVTLSLAPGEARLRQDVMLDNPRAVRQRHYFWANSAVPASDDLHLIYPCNRARTLGGEWPYPIVNGRDMSWYRNHERPNDIFALDVVDDFFGCYYVERDAGLVHWSDHRVNVGKKFFTWGTADEGMIWVDLLTDEDGQYVELQSGRFVDQSTFEFLWPYQQVGWREYWYPLSGTGGFVWATQEAALNLERAGAVARVAAAVTRDLGGGELVLEAQGREVFRQGVELTPGRPFRGEVPVGDVPEDAPMSLWLRAAGREVIRYDDPPAYRTRRPLEIRSEPLRAADDAEVSAGELCAHAVGCEKHTDFPAARRLYERALERDSRYAPAHLGLGRLHFAAGLYEEARRHLEAAVGQDRECDEAVYYLAVTLLAQGEEAEAGELLWRLVGRTACRVEAAVTLAKLALRAGDPCEALCLLGDLPLSATTSFLRALAARLADAADEEALVDALARDPLAVNLHAEAYLGALAGGEASRMEEALAGLRRATDDDPELWIELALEYRELARPEEAARLLRAGREGIEAVRSAPMAAYVLASVLLEAEAPDAEEGVEPGTAELEEAAAADPEYCFPSRVEEMEVLREAIARDPGDWRARLYLGNVLAFLDRRDETLDVWLEAAGMDDSSAVLCRNIALAHQLWRGDTATAVDWYGKAIARRPDEYHLYVERDRCLVASGAGPGDRLVALEAAPEAVVRRWELAATRAECLVALERWDEALELMRSHRFRPWEGARGMHALWTRALVGRAAARREAGDPAGALADYELALTYPRNLGVGRAAYPQEAEVHWLAAEVAGELGDERTRMEHLAAAADEAHARPCRADLYSLRALRALGRQGEGEKLAERLRAWAGEVVAGRPEEALAKEILAELT